MPKVEILIIDYKTLSQAEALTEEMKRTTTAKVILHDNTPKNENLHHLWNRYLEATDSDFLVNLSPDTKPVAGWLDLMLELLHSQPQVAAVGPSTDHCYNEQANRHPEVVKFARESWVPNILVPGFCAVYRTSVLRRLGGWRESFAFYGGDVDLVYRMQLAGWMTAWCVPAFVWHEGGSSARKLGQPAYDRLREQGNRELGQAFREYGQLPGLWVHVGKGKVERRRLDGAEEEMAVESQGG